MSGIVRQDKLYIGGEWVDPIDGEVVPTIDPSTGEPWAEVAFGGPKDVDRAVAAAREAFEGPWRRMPVTERAALLRRFAEIYARRADELVQLEARDSGRAIREVRADVGNHANWFYWFASLADKMGGRTIPIDETVHAFTTRHPVGVVGGITPWNVPLMSTVWKLAPALAAGCTFVHKPAEQTPFTAFELARMGEEAGLPPGVINTVPGYGPTTGAHLVAHPDVDKISFTGEGRTASEIQRTAAGSLKRFSFELGGKSPHILFEDCDLEQALNAATGSAFVVCGQSCALGSRLYVHRSIYGRVAEEIARRAGTIRVGSAMDFATQMGPQSHLAQLEKTLSYIDIGKQEGASLLAGGSRIEELGKGYYVQPTVFADVTSDMRIAREEIFGPVVSLIPFDSEEEVVALANNTRYGLAAGLWTRDAARAHRVAARIDAGIVWVNTYRFLRWSTPYGGFKGSGVGRENGVEAIDAYLETKTTVISTTGTFADPYAV